MEKLGLPHVYSLSMKITDERQIIVIRNSVIFPKFSETLCLYLFSVRRHTNNPDCT